MGRKGRDPFAEFRALSRHEQREHILSVAALCIDGAPRTLARKIEIYLAEPGCDHDCSYCHLDEYE